MRLYLSLFLNFLKIGAFTFGGAYGAIPLIREAVLTNGWLSEEQFSYDEDGNIYGMTDGADEAIRILGLDCSPLVNARRQAIEPYANMTMENAEWLVVIEDLLRRHDGVFLPFCFATVSYIRNFKMAI